MDRSVMRMVRTGLAASCVLLATPVCASSVTVVSHGADFFGLGGPLWDLGESVYDYWATQPGGAAEYFYNKTTLELVLMHGSAANDNKVIVFNWADESDRSQGGYDEAAGDAMFAMLHANDLLNSDYLHLIGHSRGAVVVSEAAQRALHYGYGVDQMTLLDYENGPSPYDDAGPAYGWEGIGLVDNYYGDGSLSIGGHQVLGAYNQHIAGVDHTDFPAWYATSMQTLDGTAPGFYLRVADGPAPPPDTAPRTVAAPPDVINGDFEYGVLEVPITGIPAENKAEIIAGWDYHGGTGTAHVDYLELSDYDLEFDSGNVTKRHNWLYAPEDAYQLAFSAKADFAILQADEFWLYLRSQDNAQHHEYHVFNTTVATATKGWETYAMPLDAYGDSVFRFSFNLTAPGTLNFIDSQVQVDNVRFLLYAPCDFNRDGGVDEADLAAWAGDYGGDAGGDGDKDGDCDGADFLLWQQQLGSGPVVTAAVVTVPEPAAATAVIALASIALAARRRRAGCRRS